MQVTVALQTLPSGHIAIDVLSFGERGFVCPAEVSKAGLSDSDFRWTSGSESAGTKVNLLSCAVFNQGSSGSVPPCFSASRRRCGDGSCEAFAKQSTSVGELAHSLGQGSGSVAASWARGMGAFMAASGFSGESILGTFFRAAKSKVKPAMEDASRVGEACEEGQSCSDVLGVSIGVRSVCVSAETA